MEEDGIPIEVSKEEVSPKEEKKSCKWSLSGNGVLYLLGFLIALFLGAFAILWIIHPIFVLDQSTGKIDWGKLSLASGIFALLGLIIIWIILSCSSK